MFVRLNLTRRMILVSPPLLVGKNLKFGTLEEAENVHAKQLRVWV